MVFKKLRKKIHYFHTFAVCHNNTACLETIPFMKNASFQTCMFLSLSKLLQSSCKGEQLTSAFQNSTWHCSNTGKPYTDGTSSYWLLKYSKSIYCMILKILFRYSLTVNNKKKHTALASERNFLWFLACKIPS